MKRTLLVALAGVIVLAIMASAPAADDAAEVQRLRAENKMLRTDNAALRADLKSLQAGVAKLAQRVRELETKNAQLKARPKQAPATAPAAPKPKPAIPPAIRGDLVIGASPVAIKRIPLRNEITGKKTMSKNKLLAIEIAVLNRSETKKLQYRTWGAEMLKLGGSSATLADDLGNTYKGIYFGGLDTPVGRTDNESIYPAKAIVDVLVFELPIAKAKRLILTLPLANVGGDGVVKITIPVGQIKRNVE